MSKAMAEKLMVARARNSKTTVFCAVRYGNVMASRGSVIPLFIDQIKNNKNITITNPKMTRFLLSLDHAIDLVEFAIKNGRSGDIFVKKAPAATVENLAKALIEIFDAKNKTEVIGVRGGEKIHETLANSVELMTAEDMGDYFRINSEPVNSYEKFYEKGIPAEIKDDYTSENTQQLSVTAVKELLLSLDYIKKELKQ
jgi:UDP-glucose 4-epimerase